MSGGDLEERLGVRRLTARSVIVSTLLGVTPPELPTRSLVGTAELLGIAPGTARVAMSRMVAAGELAATGDGYRLVSPTLLARQARQQRSRTGVDGSVGGGVASSGSEPGGWDGAWHAVVVTGEARPQAERVGLRSTLLARRYGELREGVWMRPDNLGPDQRVEGSSDGVGRLMAMEVRPEDPVELAAALWDLEMWAERAQTLLVEVERLTPPLEGGDPASLAEDFVVSAAVLRHFQTDPLLPTELLPPDWPGRALRRRYDTFDTAFRTTLTAWQRRDHSGG